MGQITRDSLMTLEAYAKARPALRAQTIEHKKNRRVQLGEHVALMFEDELTLRYQIQEMLRVEKTFLEEGIQDELNAYTPLVPDGNNWKATMLIEYPDVDERRVMLAKLKGVEDKVYVQVEVTLAFTLSLMKIWSAKTRKRPHRYIFCALICNPRWQHRSKPARRWRWGWTILPILHIWMLYLRVHVPLC